MSNNSNLKFKESMISVCKPITDPNSIEYNKSIKINFPPSDNHSALDFKYIDFDFSTYLTEFDSTVQDALIITGTRSGSDISYPEKGNDLEIEVATGYVADQEDLIHTANFAALDVKTFINNRINDIIKSSVQNIEDDDLRNIFIEHNKDLSTYNLTPSTLNAYTVILNAVAGTLDGETIGGEVLVET